MKRTHEMTSTAFTLSPGEHRPLHSRSIRVAEKRFVARQRQRRGRWRQQRIFDELHQRRSTRRAVCISNGRKSRCDAGAHAGAQPRKTLVDRPFVADQRQRPWAADADAHTNAGAVSE